MSHHFTLTPLETVRVAVDCMGGDHGPSVTLPACQAFLNDHPHAELLLVGAAETLAPAAAWPRTTVVPATEVVAMDDPVEVALRRKRDSSMRVAVNLLKRGDDGRSRADVVVSAGNTGALMAISRYVLKTVDGIDRPAIATVLPNERGFTTMLDLGANIDCTAEHLLQFAVMGSALVSAVDGKAEPSVGLLNVGSEAIKGSDTLKRAGELLRAAADDGHLNYHGNVEGDDIFKGTVDIIVCDGFVGNVALKTSEGLARMLGGFLKSEFKRHWFAKLGALVALPVLRRFRNHFDPRGYNGAALLGLQGLVFKSHGSADAYAFGRALARAYDAARHRLPEQVHERIVDTLQATAAASSAEPVRPAA